MSENNSDLLLGLLMLVSSLKANEIKINDLILTVPKITINQHGIS